MYNLTYPWLRDAIKIINFSYTSLFARYKVEFSENFPQIHEMKKIEDEQRQFMEDCWKFNDLMQLKINLFDKIFAIWWEIMRRLLHLNIYVGWKKISLRVWGWTFCELLFVKLFRNDIYLIEIENEIILLLLFNLLYLFWIHFIFGYFLNFLNLFWTIKTVLLLETTQKWSLVLGVTHHTSKWSYMFLFFFILPDVRLDT